MAFGLQVHILAMLENPELEAALQVGSCLSKEEGQNPLSPAAHAVGISPGHS